MNLSRASPMEQSENALYYRLVLSDMVSGIRLYFYNGIAYNGGGDRRNLLLYEVSIWTLALSIYRNYFRRSTI